ncbi:MAG: hypothetical protein JNL11_11595 [Bdellovibrionaceae bacterium]|nr:hypothetical protein [Pseudobdellovibrionaceae bacterium]
MCGIAAVFGKNVRTEMVMTSLKQILHRGSEHLEVASLANAILGTNRLAIVDPQNGKQPAHDQDKNVYAILNGEIYNHAALRKKLIQLGHVFRSHSDTEVLVHLWKEYGPSLLDHLDSEMFAFIIYDERYEQVFAARDPLGVKPLYYARDENNNIHFGSELKQLSVNDRIQEIRSLPAGHYFLNQKIECYFTLNDTIQIENESVAVDLIENSIIAAVKKRVDTELPLAVFLSGGVDSSLVMELAVQNHPDVKAFILGHPGSGDYEFAVRLCRERGYKYETVTPDEDYTSELEKMIFFSETFEPLLIRHAFAGHMCARAAHSQGYKIVLMGEGSDEIFAGYNEFLNLSEDQIHQASVKMTSDLADGHLKRVDRFTSAHTLEARLPFLDMAVVRAALSIDPSLKIRNYKQQATVKYILRKVAERHLPEWIAWRKKEPFSNGAGMEVGEAFLKEDGEVASEVKKRGLSPIDETVLQKYSLRTHEEKFYFQQFKKFQFTKLVTGHVRLLVKDNLSSKYNSGEVA